MTETRTNEAVALAAAAMLLARRHERLVARKLIRAERAHLRAITVATNGVIDTATADAAAQGWMTDSQARRATHRSIRNSIPAMIMAVAGAVVAGRRAAREDAGEDIEEVSGREAPPPAQSEDLDQAHAIGVASSTAAAWGAMAIRAADRAHAKGQSVPAAIRSTRAQLEPRVRRVAATETAHAFNDERAAIADVIHEMPAATPYRTPGRVEEPQASPVEYPKMARVWSAILDLKVCPTCARMNGTVIPLGAHFAVGEPPIHANCRCVVVVMPVHTSIQDVAKQWNGPSVAKAKAPEPAPETPPTRPFVQPEFTNPSPLPTPTDWSQKALLDDAIAKANERGVIHMNYIRGSMRDMKEHRAAYAGATAKEVEAIATGRMPAKNSGRTLPPIKVTLDTGELVLQDGRHRMTVAIEAGAKNISAVVRTYTKSGKSISREITLSLRGLRVRD